MLDVVSARLRTLRSNIARYRRLLETNLTELEREYIERRLSEEQSNLEALEVGSPNSQMFALERLSGNIPPV